MKGAAIHPTQAGETTSRARVFYDPRSLELDGPSSVLHAKAVVTDNQTVIATLMPDAQEPQTTRARAEVLRLAQR